jgi:hypothetical protein
MTPWWVNAIKSRRSRWTGRSSRERVPRHAERQRRYERVAHVSDLQQLEDVGDTARHPVLGDEQLAALH